MRKIKIYSTVGVSGSIDTNVRTLGELKPLLRQREIDYSGMKLLVGETRNELNVDDAVLPEGDFKLYLMPQKTKSGNGAKFARLNELIGEFQEIVEGLEEDFDNQDSSYSAPKASYTSYEDEQALADIRALAAGGSGSAPKQRDPWG